MVSIQNKCRGKEEGGEENGSKIQGGDARCGGMEQIKGSFERNGKSLQETSRGKERLSYLEIYTGGRERERETDSVGRVSPPASPLSYSELGDGGRERSCGVSIYWQKALARATVRFPSYGGNQHHVTI